MSEIVDYALTTIAKAKTHLGISGTDDDTLLERIVNYATDFIESYCDRRFDKTTYSNELYDGDDFDYWLYLKNLPITTLTKIEQNNGTTDEPDWDELDEGDDYEKYLTEGKIYIYDRVTGKRNYRVNYEAGYTTIPYDLEMLCIRLVARIYEKRKSEGRSAESLGPANISWESFIKEEDKMTLNKYKKVNI